MAQNPDNESSTIPTRIFQLEGVKDAVPVAYTAAVAASCGIPPDIAMQAGELLLRTIRDVAENPTEDGKRRPLE